MRPVLAVALVLLASFSRSQPTELPIVTPNDNRVAAGVKRARAPGAAGRPAQPRTLESPLPNDC